MTRGAETPIARWFGLFQLHAALLVAALLGATTMLVGCASPPSPRQPTTSKPEVRARKKVAVKRAGNSVLVTLTLVVECQTVDTYDDKELPSGWVNCNKPPPREDVASIAGIRVTLQAGTITLEESTSDKGVAEFALENLLESAVEPKEAQIRVKLHGERERAATASLEGAPIILAWRNAAKEREQAEAARFEAERAAVARAHTTDEHRLALAAILADLPLDREYVDLNAVERTMRAIVALEQTVDPESQVIGNANEIIIKLAALAKLTSYPRISLQASMGITLGLLNDPNKAMWFFGGLRSIVIRASATIDALASQHDRLLTGEQRAAVRKVGEIARENSARIESWEEAYVRRVRGRQ